MARLGEASNTGEDGIGPALPIISMVKRYLSHGGINYCTPNTRHSQGDDVHLMKRKAFMEQQRKLHPERWINGKVMNCEPAKEELRANGFGLGDLSFKFCGGSVGL